MTEGLRTQTPGLVADDVRLPSPSLAGAFGNDVLLAQTFVVLWHVCASGDPGRIFGVFLWFTFASASGVSTYAIFSTVSGVNREESCVSHFYIMRY